MLAHRRLVSAVMFVLAAFTAIAPAVPASAADAGTPLLPNWIILDATVTRTGTPPRHMTSKHAAAFIQSWYIATIYGTLPAGDPPASLPVYTFKANERINGQPFTFTALYATNGTKAWVGLPKQVLGPGAYVPVKKWFIATPRATPAFLGKLDPTPTGGPTTTTTTTPVPVSDRSSGSSQGWIIAVVAIGVLVGLGLVLLVRARRRPSVSRT